MRQQVNLRGLGMAECERKVALLIAQQIEEDLLRFEVDFIGTGTSTDGRLARTALLRARLSPKRDETLRLFHDFVVELQALVR